MTTVCRILGKFNITGRGLVYMLIPDSASSLQINDILTDLHRNHFKVKGFEMICMRWDKEKNGNLPIGVLFEPLDGREVQGNLLVGDFTDINFIFCNHALAQRNVDEDYEAEYQIAKLKHSCALFSYEDMEQGKLSLFGEHISGLTIYRGWMMKPAMYKTFYEKLEENNIILINTPAEYENYHLLPKWYETFADNTAESIWTENAEVKDILLKAKDLKGAYIVKDYVKSRKHEWYDACLVPQIREYKNAEKIISNFIERQGESLVGGIVLRHYEELNQIGFHEKSGMPISEEYRVFIYAGRVIAIDEYWTAHNHVSLSKEEYKWLDSIVQKINSNFVTVDLARTAARSLMIIEFGDGQVSGLQQIPEEVFYRGFLQEAGD